MVTDAPASRPVTDFRYTRHHVDLTSHEVRTEDVRCQDLEDVLGGIASGFKLLEGREVDDAYDAAATLIMNLGILSGTDFMTGLRTFFHAYSPLKRSLGGKPSAMWAAGSGKFGTKLRHLGVQEVLFSGRSPQPVVLHIHRADPADLQSEVRFSFEDASALAGKHINDKVQTLYKSYPDAHFAVIGPAGENYANVRYAAIGLSTENQLRSGDAKMRFAGRGGMGGVMGSKNLLGIVADTTDPKRPPAPPVLKDINGEVARGEGSRYYREKSKGEGLGGTWHNYAAMQPIGAVPEENFAPTGTDASAPLIRANVEAGPFVVKDASCYRCGISCHKNVYDKDAEGKAGKFRAKLDYEPLNLLSSNIGIYDPDQACTLVDLVDELGMDSISCGATLGYAMEHNRRHEGEDQLAGGLRFGDFEAVQRTLTEIGEGRLPELGQGSLRLSEQTGEPGYAMHCKGVEFPAYLPHTNPGYPWALAGGHMSMRTYLLLVFEKETDFDYWVKAITKRGIGILRDDIVGICKFSGVRDDLVADGIRALTGLEIDKGDLKQIVRRTFLRGYALEKRVGFTAADYTMPDESHDERPNIQLPYFNDRDFFARLSTKVNETFDAMLVEEGLG